MPDPRPDLYPDVDRNKTNSSALPLAESLNGYADNAALPAADLNGVLSAVSDWIRWFDQRALIIPETTSDDLALTLGSGVSYVTGSGSLTTAANGGGMYHWRGVRLDLLSNKLPLYSLDSVTWAATRDNYLFISDEYVVTQLDVAVAAPAPATPADSFLLGVARTNGIEVTTWFPGDAPARFMITQTARVQNDGSRGWIEIAGNEAATAPGLIIGRSGGAVPQVTGQLRAQAAVSATTPNMWLDGGSSVVPCIGWDSGRVLVVKDHETIAEAAGVPITRRLRGHVDAVDADLIVESNYCYESTAVVTVDTGLTASVDFSPALGVSAGYAVGGKIRVIIGQRSDGAKVAVFDLFVRVQNVGGLSGAVKIISVSNPVAPDDEFSNTQFALTFLGSAVSLDIINDAVSPNARAFVYWDLSLAKIID